MNATSSQPPAAPTPRANRLQFGAMGGLLAFVAFGIFVIPVLGANGQDVNNLSKIVLALILGCGIASVSAHRRLAFVLALLALGVLASWAVEAAGGLGKDPLLDDLLLLAALLVLVAALALNAFGGRRDVRERLFAAITLYLVLGLVWAALYGIVAVHDPRAFSGTVAANATMFDWGYLSLVTLTTVGYGDVTPVTHVARSLAASEAVVGELYPAVVIARLIIF